MNTIADLIDLEHAAADEAHVTGLPLEHCQQYVRRNADLIARLDAEADLRHQFKATTGRPYLPHRGDTITHEVTA